ncbi:hypothetical protein PQX77_018394 [Marasmius sp. AFHP31]|nr:hypothetical protein PQX77_018394 [Marasmius sp. AFHP31]
MSQFFHRAKNTKIQGGNITIQHIEGNVIHNYGSGSNKTSWGKGVDWVMPEQNEYREILKGDIKFREQTWSESMEAVVRRPSRDNNPFRKDTETRLKVIKTFYTATIFPYSDWAVTVVTFEPADTRDKGTMRLVSALLVSKSFARLKALELWRQVYEAYSTQRSPRLAQMLGLMKSVIPAFILHEELANGQEFVSRYRGSIVWDYLLYTHELAIQILSSPKTLMIPVSSSWSDWAFNLKTGFWLYDPASASISPPSTFNCPLAPIPLLLGSRPRLNAGDIVAYFEQNFGDFVYLPASLGRIWEEDLSKFAQHGYLTFGAVVQPSNPECLAHFSSTPAPTWHFEDHSYGVEANYSKTATSRIDLTFENSPNVRLNLHFSLCFPKDDRTRLRAAYLSQFHSRADHWTFFIDEIGFSLTGHFSRPILAYLFVPHLRVEYVDGVYRLRYPLPSPLLYWSSDPDGKSVLPKRDWETYGVPQLEVTEWIGSYWFSTQYECVRNHLRAHSHASDVEQYVERHSYPYLIHGGVPYGLRHHQQRLKKLAEEPLSVWELFQPQSASRSAGMAAETQPLTTSKYDGQKRRQLGQDTADEGQITGNPAQKPISVPVARTTRTPITGNTSNPRKQQPETGKTTSQAKPTKIVLQKPILTRSLQMIGKAVTVTDEGRNQPERARNQAKTRGDPVETATPFRHTIR